MAGRPCVLTLRCSCPHPGDNCKGPFPPGYEQWGRWCMVRGACTPPPSLALHAPVSPCCAFTSALQEDESKHSFGDVLTRNLTQQRLRDAKGKAQPFFVAMGLHRPHLPWSSKRRLPGASPPRRPSLPRLTPSRPPRRPCSPVPKRFFDMYPAAEDLPQPKHPRVPVDSPPIAWHSVPGASAPARGGGVLRRCCS